MKRRAIHWKQLWSLAALYASIIIGWIAYENYQPRLLTQFGFTAFAFALTVAQGLIITVTPLVAGRIGDRYRHQKGHRLPVISSGISIAAMIFMAVAFTVLGNPGELLRWLLPVLIVFWLVAMSIFTSPALSTVELFTPVDKLPQAMAVLTITGNLVYALEPVIIDIIDQLGAPLTFSAGGVAVFISGYALRKNSLALFNKGGARDAVSPGEPQRVSPYGSIFFLGLAVGVATVLLFRFFGMLPAGRWAGPDEKTIVVTMLVLPAFLSWPVMKAIRRYGLTRVFRAGIVLLAFSLFVAWSSPAAIVVMCAAVLFSLAFTMLSLSALPLVIGKAAVTEKVFCVGVFFSGVALPEACWEIFLAYLA